jgi:hypothetical protein
MKTENTIERSCVSKSQSTNLGGNKKWTLCTKAINYFGVKWNPFNLIGKVSE